MPSRVEHAWLRQMDMSFVDSEQQLSIPHNASIWSIIKQLKSEESLVQVKLREAAVGAGKDNSARATYQKNRRAELKELVSNYENLSKKSYMEYMVANYNHDLSYAG